jgi:alcohol dehydrogenase
VLAVDSVEDRLEMAESFGAMPIHRGDDDVRAVVKRETEDRGADVTVDAVGHPDAFELACRLTRKAGTVSAVGVYVEQMQVHMGLIWVKALTVCTGHANVIGHVDTVLDLIETGQVDPLPMVTHHMKLADAPEAYAAYDRRQALKIVLEP